MYEESRNNNSDSGVDILIGAGEKAAERGDYAQAERLLKTGLFRLQLQSQTTTSKMRAVIERLIRLNEQNGNTEEVASLKELLAEVGVQSGPKRSNVTDVARQQRKRNRKS